MGNKEIMDYQTAVEQMKEIDMGDRESAHVEADNILIDFLRDSGMTELVDAYEKLSDKFRYA